MNNTIKIGKKRNFSDEQKKEFARLYNEGNSLRAIAKMFDTSKGTIKNNIKDLVDFRPKTSAKSEENINSIIKLYNEEVSIKDIAIKMNASPNTIKTILGREGYLDLDIYSLKYHELLPQIIEMVYAGQSLSNISKQLDISKATLSNYINWLNKVPDNYYDKNRNFELDENYVLNLLNTNIYELGILMNKFSIVNRTFVLGVDFYTSKYLYNQHFKTTRNFTDKQYIEADNYKNKEMYMLTIISKKLFNYFKNFDFEIIKNLNDIDKKMFLKGYIQGNIHPTDKKYKISSGETKSIKIYTVRFSNRIFFDIFLNYLNKYDDYLFEKISKKCLKILSSEAKSISFQIYQKDCKHLLNLFDLKMDFLD